MTVLTVGWSVAVQKVGWLKWNQVNAKNVKQDLSIHVYIKGEKCWKYDLNM